MTVNKSREKKHLINVSADFFTSDKKVSGRPINAYRKLRKRTALGMADDKKKALTELHHAREGFFFNSWDNVQQKDQQRLTDRVL